MVFQITYPTRHTDTYTSTGFVHAGVLLALTELAYAAFEEHCGVSKPDHIVAVQRATEARYRAPLRWDEGASIRVRTLEVSERSFDQAFDVVAATDGRPVAAFTHHWVWLDTQTGQTVALPEDVQQRFLEG